MRIDIELNTQSVKKAIKQLETLQKLYESKQEEFLKLCAEKIKDKANKNLEQRAKFHDTTFITKSWNTEFLIGNGIATCKLYNADDRAVYAEFGTGIVGMRSPHKKASEENYRYDVNNHGEEGWTFYNKDIGLFLKDFCGYKGHSFLYDACFDFFEHKEYLPIWQEVYGKNIV